MFGLNSPFYLPAFTRHLVTIINAVALKTYIKYLLVAIQIHNVIICHPFALLRNTKHTKGLSTRKNYIKRINVLINVSISKRRGML